MYLPSAYSLFPEGNLFFPPENTIFASMFYRIKNKKAV